MAIITIVGAGMMGSAMSFPARDNGHEVRLVGTPLDREIIERLRTDRYHLHMKRTLPEGVRALLHADGLIAAVGNVLPFATIGLGWVAPAVLGLVIGLIFRAVRPKKA